MLRFVKTHRKGILLIAFVALMYVGAFLHGNQVVSQSAAQPEASAPQAKVQNQIVSEAETAAAESPAGDQAAVAVLSVRKSPTAGAAHYGAKAPVSYFLGDPMYLDLDAAVLSMRELDVSVLIVPLAWTLLEPEQGQYDIGPYTTALDRLAKEGFSFVFVVDAGARTIVNGDQLVGRSIPAWVYEAAGGREAVNFSLTDDPSTQPFSYSSVRNAALYTAFARKTVQAFGARYGEQTLGFAPGVTPELQVKYPQENYQWYDYSEDAQRRFRIFLRENYASIEELNQRYHSSFAEYDQIQLPVINYNNSIASGNLEDVPLYVDLQRFREQELYRFVAPFFDMVRQEGYSTFAFFGQVLHPHDGIYGAGIATKLAGCVDVAVIDYAFHDGYGVVLDNMAPVMMTNYLKNAGYPRVWTGLSMTWLDTTENADFLQETVDFAAADGLCDGFMLSGLTDTAGRMTQEVSLVFGVQRRKSEAKIALYVSEWNFYHSHGEDPAYINYFTDSVAQMYRIIQFELERDVDILCDEAICSGRLADYDLVVIPAQFQVSEESKNALERYMKGGGAVIQDFRFGERDEYGQARDSWSNAYFGIRATSARVMDETVRIRQEVLSPDGALDTVHFFSSFPGLPNAYAVGAEKDVKYLFSGDRGWSYGTATKRAICLCFQPQLEYKYSRSEETKRACVSIINRAIEYVMREK